MLGNINQILRAAAMETLLQRQVNIQANIETFKETTP